jgi:hypothetical protein
MPAAAAGHYPMTGRWVIEEPFGFEAGTANLSHSSDDN